MAEREYHADLGFGQYHGLMVETDVNQIGLQVWNNEILTNTELEGLERVGIVVLGRGVELRNKELKSKWESGSGEDRVWVLSELERRRGVQIRPTGLIEEAVIKEPEKGILGREEHSIFKAGELADRKALRYAGAGANVYATVDLIEEIFQNKREQLVGVCFAAGRTPDMEAYAPKEINLTQGEVLARSVIHRLRISNEKIDLSGVQMVFQPNNVNTWDDLIASFKWALDNNCQVMRLVTVAPHMMRTKDMVKELVEQMQKEGLSVPMVEFVTAEERLKKRDDRYLGLLATALDSEAYYAVLAREAAGMRARRMQTYKSQWEAAGTKVGDFNKPIVIYDAEEVMDREKGGCKEERDVL